MTRNTLTYKQLEETKRSNLAKENLTAQELQIKRDTLAETVANNLREYGINIEKNAINKLANDQLNDRESSKLLETIRSNLHNEQIKLQQLAETARNNKERESIEKRANEIKEMDTLLTAAKATGKDPASMLISWFTNQANLQAFGGKNVLGELFGSVTTDKGQYNTWNAVQQSKSTPDVEMYNGSSFTNYQQRSPVYHGNRTRAKGRPTITDPRSVFQSKREKELNEIPEDYSNSKGPGGANYENFNESSQKVPSSRNGGQGESNIDPNNNQQSHNRQGANVIYSGGAKQSKEVGPGIGLAFS